MCLKSWLAGLSFLATGNDKMNVKIIDREPTCWVGFHLTGPWHETAPEGFGRLSKWVERNNMQGEWMAIYHGNPNKTPAYELGIETVLSVADGFQLEDSVASLRLGTLEGGQYALSSVKVVDGNFAKPWLALFQEWLPASGWRIDERPCFEHYRNDGSSTGIWDIDLYLPVIR